MASVKHNLEYAAMLTGVKLACLMPAWLADKFGAGLGVLAHAVLKSRVRVATDNLKRAMGDELSDEEISAIVKRVFKNIGRMTIEFARFSRIKLDGVRRLVVGDGEDMLKKAYDEGKGGIIITPHFGNWEIMGAWVAAIGYPMDFFTGTQHNPKVDALFQGFRREMDVQIISLAKSLRGAFKSLRSGRIGGLVPDQHDPSAKYILDFFGRPASVAKGPAVLSIRTGAPLLPFCLRRERYDKHVMIAGNAIYPPNTGDEEADILSMTAEYLKFFEDCIRKYPDQWMWTHRRWKVDSHRNQSPN